jgi:hypothetical protein
MYSIGYHARSVDPLKLKLNKNNSPPASRLVQCCGVQLHYNIFNCAFFGTLNLFTKPIQYNVQCNPVRECEYGNESVHTVDARRKIRSPRTESKYVLMYVEGAVSRWCHGLQYTSAGKKFRLVGFFSDLIGIFPGLNYICVDNCTTSISTL